MLEAADTNAFLVLSGPAPLLGGEEHFHLFLPLMLLFERARKGKVDYSKCDEAVAASLGIPWALLGVLAPRNQIAVYPQNRHRAVLGATLECWDVLDGVGPRYTIGLREGKRLWDVVTNLQYVLGQLGVDPLRLRDPLPSTGLYGILPSEILNNQ